MRCRYPGCLLGLRWTYDLPPWLDLDALGEALEEAYGRRLVRAAERWGSRQVQCLVLRFEVELRLGERPHELSVLHRFATTEADRRQHRERIEQVLTTCIERAEGVVSDEP